MENKAAIGILLLILALALLFLYLISDIFQTIQGNERNQQETIDKNSRAITFLNAPNLNTEKIIQYDEKNKTNIYGSFKQMAATFPDSVKTASVEIPREQLKILQSKLSKENVNTKIQPSWETLHPLPTALASLLLVFFSKLASNFADLCFEKTQKLLKKN